MNTRIKNLYNQEQETDKLTNLKRNDMMHQMPKLPYEMEALAPLMSKETFDFHYGKHLQTYVNNLNKLIAGTPYENLELEQIVCQADGGIYNNAAQTWNHTFFFQLLTPEQPSLPDDLAGLLTRDFGSVDQFKEDFTKAALGLFGSGWVWLVLGKDGKLSLLPTPNAGNPLKDGLKPLLVIDVWEHAYYIDYRNNRAAFIEAFWKLVNWEKVADLLG
ncbi:superoxide dismutase [Parabacteroides faecalis]|nr:superoxide dismutase [Parabacteroides faecalis]MDY6254145.1 superoxide dismutase [Bacteroidales bacterium]